ncbi:hypothetical protein CKL83_12600 [Bacillus anthracis]|uniref:Uncharacterized protein n=2 Tax=Bacillus thuringiensis TaxID=1428 RepID=A0A243CYH9_BACTU|nr:hypothetical protein BVB96_18060 [Bacillus anthracis]AUD26133.1 hypothetical protein CU648_03765 [Bacillus sp. HBCD-sjtu]KAA0748450.1 hypothetical protein DN397_20945 [Bacillus sp. AY1-10]KAB7638933.1 hypothetical protein GBN83_13755 [Bacillus sp. B3-WWTP-C-10-D-3]OPA03379.1 hypothetical protein BHL51_03810 [Bacillus cereus]OTW51691.1 hypothetical protein BK699_07635 [Bacillus thuringiensis serovar mexicanensis]OTX07694.1 hypothetical protein BK705_07885 [Bacillus thuringiensis serovar mon
MGVGTTAVSAFAGAKLGVAAAVGTVFGGPIGTVAGACIGFGVSIGSSIVTDGIKFNKGDWNHNGKQDSIKDKVKTGIGAALDKIF